MQPAPPSTTPDTSGQRHHAVIVFADVVGYSRLMADDEPGTLDRWTTLYKNVLKPEAERRRGQVGDLRGDGTLLAFERVADALAWSRLAHDAAAKTGIGDAPPLALRIAIHQGVVFSTREGLFGDAVNIAARLQQHAAPGGTVISESVKDALGGGAGEPLLDLGRLRFKNDDRSFRAFALGGGHVPPRLRPIGTLPSIAVLPLANLSGDETDAYLAAGVVDDVIQSLAGLSELTVISRGSTIGYSGPGADPVMAGRELGARYVLTGSLSHERDVVRITTKLSDVETGRQMWAGRREGKGPEVFDLQDRITQQIVMGVAPNIRASELQAALRKRPESLTAYDRMLRGVHLLYAADRPTSEQARQYLEEAMLEDPSFALPAAYASWWHCLAVGQGWSTDPESDTERAFELASRAIALEPSNALALSAKGHLLSYLRREYDAALLFFARALEACPNHAFSWMLSSTTLSFIGRAEEALARAEHALLLSPQDQSRYLYLGRVAIAHYAGGNMAEAVRWARLCRDENPGYTANLRYLIAALAHSDRLAEARAIAGDLMRLEPEFRLATFASRRQPFRQPETGAAYVERLRAAGLPD